jgi:hypothetical protein
MNVVNVLRNFNDQMVSFNTYGQNFMMAAASPDTKARIKRVEDQEYKAKDLDMAERQVALRRQQLLTQKEEWEMESAQKKRKLEERRDTILVNAAATAQAAAAWSTPSSAKAAESSSDSDDEGDLYGPK